MNGGMNLISETHYYVRGAITTLLYFQNTD